MNKEDYAGHIQVENGPPPKWFAWVPYVAMIWALGTTSLSAPAIQSIWFCVPLRTLARLHARRTQARLVLLTVVIHGKGVSPI